MTQEAELRLSDGELKDAMDSVDFSQMVTADDLLYMVMRAAIKAHEEKRTRVADQSIQALLKRPEVVHQNMLIGTIAPVSFDLLAHVLGAEETERWVQEQIQRRQTQEAAALSA